MMCSFCQRYSEMKDVELYSNFPLSYSVALIDHMVYNGEPRGRTAHYMKDGIGFPLHYCPECGRKMTEDEKKT